MTTLDELDETVRLMRAGQKPAALSIVLSGAGTTRHPWRKKH